VLKDTTFWRQFRSNGLMFPPRPGRGPRGIPLLAVLFVAGALACGRTILEDADPPASSSTRSDWPMYGRDVSRTGYDPDETVITTASVARLAPRWQADIGMGAYPPSGAPTVAGGRVFVGSSRVDGDNFFAFDAATGQALWSADIGHHDPYDFDVGLGATPAVAGPVVVAGGGDAAYYGLDAATGAIRWRHDTEAGPTGFTWSSPLISSGRVYVGISSRGDEPVRGEVRALDLATGALLASQYLVPEGRRGADIWNSPALSADGRMLALATGNDFGGYDGPYTRAMLILDPTSLAILQADQQAVSGQDLDFATTPVFFKDRQGRTLVGANHKNGVFYAYVADQVSAGPLWQRPVGAGIGMMPAFDPVRDGGTLYVVGDNGQLFALDPATGADRWPPVAVGFMYGSMALAGGLILVNSGGTVIALDAATGAQLRTLAPPDPGRAFSGPAVAGGFIYWLSGSKLIAWSVP
jgi:outer membrane protein assembly factor BamB